MADQRLTDKTALTEVAQNDLVHVVDVSDTSANAAGTSKKVTVANLKTAVSGDFIPLTGTEVGSPVTGPIEMGEETRLYINSYGVNPVIDFYDDGGIGVLEVRETESVNKIVITSNEFTFHNSNDIVSMRTSPDGESFIVDSGLGVFTDGRGLDGAAYYGANYDDNTYVQKKYVDDTKNIGITAENLTMSGTVNLDLATFDSLEGLLTGNTTITVSNTPASGQTFKRNLRISGDVGTETLTLPEGWTVYGEYVVDAINKLTIEFANFATGGLKVDCFINQPT